MNLIEKTDRPQAAEYLLAIFLAFAALGSSFMFLSPSTGNDPLIDYEANPVIREIRAVAVAVDIGIVGTVAVSALRKR